MNSAASAAASAPAGPTTTDPTRSEPTPSASDVTRSAPTRSAPSASDPDQVPADGVRHDRPHPSPEGAGHDPSAAGAPESADPTAARRAFESSLTGSGPLDPSIPLASPARSGRRPVRRSALSRAAVDLQWLLTRLADDVPGIRSVVVVSSDGLLLLSSEAADSRTAGSSPVTAPAGPSPAGPEGANGGLATIVSGLASLTLGAAQLMDAGEVRQTVIAMDYGNLFVMSVSDGSLLGVHADPDCDVNVVAYEMGLFVGRAGHVLTPEVRGELRLAADPTASAG